MRLPYRSPSRVAVVPSPSEKTRGVNRQWSHGIPSFSSQLRRSHSGSRPNKKKPITSSSSSSNTATPIARGRPRGSMAVCGTQGGVRPRAAGSITNPADQGPEEDQRWTAGPDRCSPCYSQLPASPAPVAPGRPSSSSAAQTQTESLPSPAPNLGSGFTFAWLSWKRRGDPRRARPYNAPSGNLPPLLGWFYMKALGGLKAMGTATQSGPVPATCTFLALGPHSSP